MPNPIYNFAESNKNYIHFLPFMMKKGLQAICVMEIGEKFYVLKSDKDGHEFYLDPMNAKVLPEDSFEEFQKEHLKQGYSLVFDYSKNIFNAYQSKWAGSCNFTAQEMKEYAVLLPCKWGMCEGGGRSDRTVSFYFQSLKEINKKNSFDEVTAEKQRKSMIAFMEMDHTIKIPFYSEKDWEINQVWESLKKISAMDGVSDIPEEKVVLNAGVGSYGLDIRNALWYANRHSNLEMFSFIVDRYDILSRLPMSHTDMVLDVVRGSEDYAAMFMNKIDLNKLQHEDSAMGVVIISMAKKWDEIEAKATGKNQKYLFERFIKGRKEQGR